MRNILSISMLCIATSLTVAAGPALAAPRVFVSGKGADAASCGASAAPCRTFQFALNLVDAGGVVAVFSGLCLSATIQRQTDSY
jgi:hypothetical protein